MIVLRDIGEFQLSTAGDLAFVRLNLPGKDFEQRRLTRAIATRQTIDAYRALLREETGGEEMWTRLQVDSRLGVVEGTLEAR